MNKFLAGYKPMMIFIPDGVDELQVLAFKKDTLDQAAILTEQEIRTGVLFGEMLQSSINASIGFTEDTNYYVDGKAFEEIEDTRSSDLAWHEADLMCVSSELAILKKQLQDTIKLVDQYKQCVADEIKDWEEE